MLPFQTVQYSTSSRRRKEVACYFGGTGPNPTVPRKEDELRRSREQSVEVSFSREVAGAREADSG